jgi:putative ATP-binding cassette transporter
MTSVGTALRTFVTLALPFFRSEDRWRARLLLAGVIVAELALVGVLVLVNHWNARFFNALEARQWDAFTAELVNFLVICACAIVAAMAQYFAGQALIIRWRAWLTHRYIGDWMREGRHYRMRFTAAEVDNVHLRIAGDILLFLQRTHELGTGLLGSVVALVSFAFILWGLSASTPLPLFGTDWSFAGWLVFLAIGYALTGTLIAHWIGKPLIPLNFHQQRTESDFRFAIARLNDNTEPVALQRGEAVERAELTRRFGALVHVWQALVNRQTRLTGFIAGYAQASTVVPLLVAAPAYLTGAIPLGALMQTAMAFQRVEGAFAFCIGMYSKLAEWAAIMDRLRQFELAVAAVDAHRGSARVEVIGGADGLAVEGLALTTPAGQPIARIASLDLVPGDRALIAGPSGSGKSSLFRALAGLWPLGRGTIRLPAGTDVLALPQRPYFPLGTLRQAVTYPTPPDAADRGAVDEALRAVGLATLIPRLDDTADWATILSGGEQQRVAFARALVARPKVLLLDEVASTLDEATARALYALVTTRLPATLILSIGRSAVLTDQHGHLFEMRLGADGVPVLVDPAALACPAPETRTEATILGR